MTPPGASMDYDDARVASTYRQARLLPASTMAIWRATLRELVTPTGIARVADVGCGTGRFVPCLIEAFGAPVVALDPSTAMLAAADRTPGASYVAAAAQALPLAGGSLDLAFLSMVWHHLPEPRATVAELGRVLRPGGVVFIRTPTLDGLDEFAFLRCFPESLALDRGRLPSRATLQAVFAAGGFTAAVHHTVRQTMADGPEEYRARVRARAFSSLQRIPDDAFARGLARFEAWSSSLPPAQPIHERVDVFVFRR